MKIKKSQLQEIIVKTLLNENLWFFEKFILKKLVNFKKVKSYDNFVKKTKIILNSGGDGLMFMLFYKNRMAAMTSFQQLNNEDNCRPDPFKKSTTYMLKNTARDTAFKGYGFGSLLSFVACSYITKSLRGTITSDRNTSDNAATILIKSLESIGAEKSSEFDYVGWLLRSIRSNLWKYGDEGYDLGKQIANKFEPITQPVDDDCEPSSNISMIRDYIDSEGSSGLELLRDVLQFNNSTELQKHLNSDPRVQAYTFKLPKRHAAFGVKIFKLLDKTRQDTSYDRDTLDQYSDEALDMFQNVYDLEVAGRGESRTQATDSTSRRLGRKK